MPKIKMNGIEMELPDNTLVTMDKEGSVQILLGEGSSQPSETKKPQVAKKPVKSVKELNDLDKSAMWIIGMSMRNHTHPINTTLVSAELANLKGLTVDTSRLAAALCHLRDAKFTVSKRYGEGNKNHWELTAKGFKAIHMAAPESTNSLAPTEPEGTRPVLPSLLQ